MPVPFSVLDLARKQADELRLASEFYRHKDRVRSYEIVVGLPLMQRASVPQAAAA